MASDSDCTMGGSDSELPLAESDAESDEKHHETAEVGGSHDAALKQHLATSDDPGVSLPADSPSANPLPFLPAVHSSAAAVGDRAASDPEEAESARHSPEAVPKAIPAASGVDAASLDDGAGVVNRRVRLRSKTPDPTWHRRHHTARRSAGGQGQNPDPSRRRRGHLREAPFTEAESCPPGDAAGAEPEEASADATGTIDDNPSTVPVMAPPRPLRRRPRHERKRLTPSGEDPNDTLLVPPPPAPHSAPRPKRRLDTGELVSQVLDEAPLDKIIVPGSEDERWVRTHPLWIKITQRGYPLPFGEREILALKAYTPQRHGGDAVVSLT